MPLAGDHAANPARGAQPTPDGPSPWGLPERQPPGVAAQVGGALCVATYGSVAVHCSHGPPVEFSTCWPGGKASPNNCGELRRAAADTTWLVLVARSPEPGGDSDLVRLTEPLGPLGPARRAGSGRGPRPNGKNYRLGRLIGGPADQAIGHPTAEAPQRGVLALGSTNRSHLCNPVLIRL